MLTDTRLLASNAWDVAALSELKSEVRVNPQSKQAQLAVARQVESLFVQMMLKSMREALPQDGLLSSDQTRLYTSMYDQQIAQQIGERGLGLAEAVVKQMSPIPAIAPADNDSKNKVPLKFDLQTVVSYRNQKLDEMVRRAVPKLLPDNREPPAGFNREFIMQLAQPARAVSQQTGIPHRLILAQAVLESGWGKRQIRQENGEPSFNLFGIKASADWKGPVAESITTEYENGVAKKVKAKFRVYHSYFESLTDYIRLLTQNPRYAGVAKATTPEQGAYALQHAGYATDPAYAKKLNSIIQQLKSMSDKVSKAYSVDELSNLF